MRLTRRKTLIGLGTLASAVGLIGASGAFDTVQADRDFDVELDDDSDALLEFTVPDDSEYVETSGGENGNEVIEISIGADSDDHENAGLNDNAITAFNDLFTIGNNGTDDDVWFDTSNVDGVMFYEGTNDGTALDEDNPGTVEDGDSDLDVGLKVDTQDGGYEEPEDGDVYNITIHAESEESDD